MKFDTFEVDGKKFTIDVRNEGQFCTVIDGDDVHADTYEKLKQKIVRAQRRTKVRVALPATVAKSSGRWNGDDEALIDVEITGIHQRNRNFLYRRVDTGKANDDSGYNDTFLKRQDAAGKAKYMTLLKAKRDATTAFDKFKSSITLNKEAVIKQVADAEKAAGLEPEERD